MTQSVDWKCNLKCRFSHTHTHTQKEPPKTPSILYKKKSNSFRVSIASDQNNLVLLMWFTLRTFIMFRLSSSMAVPLYFYFFSTNEISLILMNAAYGHVKFVMANFDTCSDMKMWHIYINSTSIIPQNEAFSSSLWG